MKTNRPLHERLRHARRSINMIQAKVAQHMNVSQSTVSNWERGIQEPTLEELLKLSRLYAVKGFGRVKARVS